MIGKSSQKLFSVGISESFTSAAISLDTNSFVGAEPGLVRYAENEMRYFLCPIGKGYFSKDILGPISAQVVL